MNKHQLVMVLFALMFLCKLAMDYMDVGFTHYWVGYAVWCLYTGLLAYVILVKGIGGFGKLIKGFFVILAIAGLTRRTYNMWIDAGATQEVLWAYENRILVEVEKEEGNKEYYMQEAFLGGLLSKETFMSRIDSCTFSQKNMERASLLTICNK